MERRCKLHKVVATSLILSALTGCVSRQVYFAKPAVPVRLGQDIKGAKVFISDGGKMVECRADLFKGQWVLTVPDDWDVNSKKEVMNVQPPAK